MDHQVVDDTNIGGTKCVGAMAARFDEFWVAQLVAY